MRTADQTGFTQSRVQSGQRRMCLAPFVLPLKGSPVGGGFRMPGVVVAPLVYAFWGLGMWLVYSALQRPLGASPAPAR
jgi:hypothetical protein